MTALPHNPAHSDHRPLLLTLRRTHPHTTAPPTPPPSIPRFRYNPTEETLAQYRSALSSDPLLAPTHLSSLPGPQAALLLQQRLLHHAATAHLPRPPPPTHSHPSRHHNQPWFDAECKATRRRLRAAMANPSSHLSQHLSREFKALCRSKKSAFRHSRLTRLLEDARHDPAAFWRQFRPRNSANKISSATTWHRYCRSLFALPSPRPAPPPLPPADPDQLVAQAAAATSLSAPFTAAEVLTVLKRLRRNKAAGIDGMRSEFITDAPNTLAPALAAVFTSLLASPFPPSLNCQLVHPIFKGKGDALDPSNYRCLSVGPALTKIYAMLLEARLAQWAESCGARAPSQAGFRSDHRTTDHIFTLHTLISQARARRRPLYCCFVDFKKAFDSVPRELLWQRLREAGIDGPFLSALQSLYACVTARACTPSGLTDPFRCDLGVKQGCPLSPLLFGLYIDRVAPLITAADPTAPALAGLTVALLLYADDLTLLSTTPDGLQRQLDALHSFCLSSQLDVNLAATKTEVVVFNPPPPSRSTNTTWHLGGSPITPSTSYRYLGITFHATKGITTAPTHLHAAGERALHALHRRCAELRITTPATLCHLFDSLVSPVLSYACEVWAFAPGTAKPAAAAEVLHRTFLRRIAGMHHTTLNAATYAEFGRTPLSLTWHRLATNFFCRLASLPEGRLARHALLEALSLEQCGHHTGLGGLRSHLASIGISGSTAEELASIDPNTAKAAALEQWAAVQWPALLRAGAAGPGRPPNTTSQRTHYSSLCPAFSFSPQPYLCDHSIPHTHRCTMSRFRCGTHWLATHTARYRRAAEKQRLHYKPCSRCHIHTWDDSNPILLCSECDSAWHCRCLDPPLDAPPPDEHWYCPPCTARGNCTPTAALAEAARTSTCCPHCAAPSEDVPHFLFTCPFYQELRDQFPVLFPHPFISTRDWLSQPAPALIAAFLFFCFQAHRNFLAATPQPNTAVS